MSGKKRPEIWSYISWGFIALFALILVYPMFGILKQSVFNEEGVFTLEQFQKFFSQKYYSGTIINSFEVTVAVTAVTLLLGIPFAYFYSFYQIKGAKLLFVVSILCCMSAPFIGAYSWIMLLGRSGVITQFVKDLTGCAWAAYTASAASCWCSPSSSSPWCSCT